MTDLSFYNELPSIRKVIDDYGLRAEKSLGQNFLFDLNITDKIARYAGNLKDFYVMEIGPGPGALTRSILGAGATSLYAIEKDIRCINALNSYLVPASKGCLKICESDALNYDGYKDFDKKVKIIANLPYNIGTELLIRWLYNCKNIESMTLMFQKEVAERIVAKPGNKSYGRLSVLVQYLCKVEKVFDLPPTVFYPPPKIHSAVVHLEVRQEPIIYTNLNSLEKIVKSAFSMRRKTLRSNLKSISNNIDDVCKKLGIDSSVRAEQLTVEQFCLLTNELT